MRGTTVRRTGLAAALGVAIALCLAVAQPAVAQEVQRIAAVVNDQVISIYDLARRLDLVIRSSGMPDNPEQRRRLAPQVMRGLIDETLQSQEAARLNINVSQADVDTAIAQIEANNKLPKGGFGDFVARQGLTIDTVMAQIRPSLAWQKLIARRVVPTIDIGEEDIDAVLARIKEKSGGTELRLAEIVLPIDDQGQAQDVVDLARRLVSQVRGGAPFAPIARQFSRSASAATGGDIGWVAEGQLSTADATAVSGLKPGEVADPIVEPDVIRIVYLIERRSSGGGGGGDARLTLRQLGLPLAPNATKADTDVQISLAAQIGAAAKDCADFARLAAEQGSPQPAEPIEVRAGDLADHLRAVIDGVPAGKAAPPVVVPGSVQVIMICSREANQGPAREDIRESLLRERVDMMSRRYLRDLRRAAFVDVRAFPG
ncbi:MAG: peptidylprolyl isomerase [Alphaproteobacteria bacterium]